jgi:L,D-transpeptidase YbiS
MSGLWRFMKKVMLGVALLWMTIEVQASNPADRVERLLARLSPDEMAGEQMALQKEITALRRQNNKLRAKVQGLLPEDPYIVVDTNAKPNRLFLREGQQTLLDAICSTGKGDTLRDPKNGRVWVFKTPLGVHTVKRKKTDPIWTKPDWAFIEENEPIPKDRSKRLEEGVLGDYALDIGDDYMIHGTIYTRLLGQPVTHGCIRLYDDDLKVIYDASKKGTKVYIF